MNGYELQRARQLRRAELRRSASEAMFLRLEALALDRDELIKRADLGDVNAHGNAVKRRLILMGLRSAGCDDAAIAEAWSVTREQLADWMRVPLLEPKGYVATIEHDVLEELPETPEPDRVVPPELAIAPGWVRAQSSASP